MGSVHSLARAPGAAIAALVGSRTNYWATFTIDVLAATGFLAWGIASAGATGSGALGALAGGWLGWTLFEYLMHRFVFHGRVPLVARAHLDHHRAPREPIGMPFFLPVSIAFAWWACLDSLLAGADARFAVAGSYAGYVWYACVHYATHAVRLRGSPIAHRQRMHLAHHARIRCNFGATTDLWDRVFGTHAPPRSWDRAVRAATRP